MNKERKSGAGGYKVWEPLLLAIMVVVGMFAGQRLVINDDQPRYLARIEKEKSLAGDRIEELIKFVESRYVDDVDSDALVKKAIEAVLSELDPHSSYLPPHEVLELDAKMRGSFEGIGIEFDQFDDTILVIHVIPDGPAMKAGIRPGDKLITANDSSLIKGFSDETNLIKKLKGKKGTTVKLGILRPGEQNLLYIEVTRDVIPIISVPAAFMIDGNNGYIKIDRFSSTTYKEFMDAVEEMVDQGGMDNLIIDVRQNPGGYLQEAVNILSQLFKDRNELIVYTEGEHSKRSEYKTTGNQFFDINKVAVLIDESSASASEIIAGAVQDHDRGIIIGTQSFGKGLVQEQYKLSNGGALRLTVARYYTPSGRLIQRPYNGEIDENHASYYNGSKGVKELDSTQFFTTNGRIVYGEGGILPDIEVSNFVDWKSLESMKYYRSMIRFAISFMNPELQNSDRDLETYESSLPSNEELAESFYDFINREDPEAAEGLNLWINEKEMGQLLRAAVLAYQFGYEQWYQQVSGFDPVILKAIDVLKSEMLYSEQLQ